MNITDLSVHDLSLKIKNRELSCVEVTRAFLDASSSDAYQVKAFIRTYAEEALETARSLDQQIQRGDACGVLTGIPIAIKDNMCIKGKLTTCASKILQKYRAPYDATVIERIQAAGGIIIGQTNMDEFAMGSSNETSCYGPTANPWDNRRIPGGSSGGSAAAVAARQAALALGSDTGGSIRQPAALCGVVGLKPTYGRVSRYGLVAFASSLDQIGPFAQDVSDAALLFQVIMGHDMRDSTSINRPCETCVPLAPLSLQDFRIGVPVEYFQEGIDPDVEKKIKEAIALLEQAGARIVSIHLPHTEYAVATYYIIATAEASANLARYDGVKYGFRAPQYNNLLDMYIQSRSQGFGAEVRRRIILGTYVLSAGYYDAYYLKAQQVRTLLRQDFENAYKQCDVILTPTSPTPAFKKGEKMQDPLQMYLSDIYTIAVNLAGLPAVSVPCGLSSEHLPIGMQIIGNHFDEQLILRLGYTYEQLSGICRLKPAGLA